MDPSSLATELRQQMRERPYWTTAVCVGAGWMLGRILPVRSFLVLAGIGARAAATSAFESAIRDRLRPVGTREARK
jgi:hypothetical protein